MSVSIPPGERPAPIAGVNAVWPNALKVFTTYHDYTDVIWAHSVNEIHDEVYSIEKTLGSAPFSGTPYVTFSGAVQDLYTNKAPVNHSHDHHLLTGDAAGDDHLQYPRADGSRGFTAPVNGVAGTGASNLVTLHQVQSFGYINAAQAEQIADDAALEAVVGAPGAQALWGTPHAGTWKIIGGLTTACTGGDGRVTIPFSSPFPFCLQAFTCTKLPPPGGGGCPNGPYNWIEAQVTLVAYALNAVVVQVSHDYSWQPYMNFSCSWIALGS
jgi:hypothetical protein